MPRNYSVEIRGRDWTIESKKMETKKQAEEWIREQFNYINGEYSVTIIDWSKQEAVNSVFVS